MKHEDLQGFMRIRKLSNKKIYNLINAPLPVPIWSCLCHLIEAHWLAVQTLSRAPSIITVLIKWDFYLFGISCIKSLRGRKSRSSVFCEMLMLTLMLIQFFHNLGVEWEGSQEGFASS